MRSEERVGRLLRARGLTLAVAESCTGGLIGGRLTAVRGSSDYFPGGVIAYANRVKVALLGVREETLAKEGAVSEAVARQMAEGARRRLRSDLAVSVTGVAGPAGGTIRKPVGLVFIGVSCQYGTIVRKHQFSGGRATIRRATVEAALSEVCNVLAAPRMKELKQQRQVRKTPARRVTRSV